MERVVAALLEGYEGRLPVWLAPVQVAAGLIRRHARIAHPFTNKGLSW